MKQTRVLKDIITHNPESASKKSCTCEEKFNLKVEKYIIKLKRNILEFDNLIKESKNKAKELNIGSNWEVFEMSEDTTKYEVSRA